MQYLAKLGLMN